MSEQKPYNSEVTCTGFSVEARCQGDRPCIIGGEVYDNRWRHVSFEKVPVPLGVPQSGYQREVMELTGLFGYHTAQALRHRFCIEGENAGATFSLETRLVAWKIHCRAEWIRQEERDYVGTGAKVAEIPITCKCGRFKLARNGEYIDAIDNTDKEGHSVHRANHCTEVEK